MGVRERLDADLKDAMRAKDQVRIDTVRSLKSALTYEEVEANAALDEAAIQKVLSKELKKRRESAEAFAKNGRPELATKEEREAGLIQGYLPEPLDAAALAALVDAAIAEAGAKAPKDMGAVMKVVQPKVAGRADGKLVSELVKARLSGA